MGGLTLREELERIRLKNNGVLKPEAVVEEAKDEKSPLHKYFTWDDSVAAHQWRLEQARRLIRAVVTIVDDHKPVIVRAYVSLTTDRGKDSYRAIRDVLAMEQYREQLLKDAFRDMEVFRRKYAVLTELAGVFAAIDAAIAKRTAVAV